MLDESVPLTDALGVVGQTKEKIEELESILPASANQNFRERLVHELEDGHADLQFREKAHRLLALYREQFGVKDLIDHFDEGIDFE